MEVEIAGAPETEESGRGAQKDLAGSGVSGCTTLQIYRLPPEFIKLLQPQCVVLFPECFQDLCNVRCLVRMTKFLQICFDKFCI